MKYGVHGCCLGVSAADSAVSADLLASASSFANSSRCSGVSLERSRFMGFISTFCLGLPSVRSAISRIAARSPPPASIADDFGNPLHVCTTALIAGIRRFQQPPISITQRRFARTPTRIRAWLPFRPPSCPSDFWVECFAHACFSPVLWRPPSRPLASTRRMGMHLHHFKTVNENEPRDQRKKEAGFPE